jgi:hypothetical protein
MLLAVVILGACGRQARDTTSGGVTARAGLPADPPAITGVVTALGPGRTLRVEANPAEGSGSPKAQITVPEGVPILERSGTQSGWDPIRPGARVSVWFQGPVRESYPIQATARAIVVEPAASAEWKITFDGYGPVRVEMTVAEAERALGDSLEVKEAGDSCAYAFPKRHTGVAFMVIGDRIARVDVRGPEVTTLEGARTGDPEERIHALYRGRVEVQPHKYVDGHYLIVRPAPGAADTTRRVIFETDGRRVTGYRAGRLPEVRWVEGCS